MKMSMNGRPCTTRPFCPRIALVEPFLRRSLSTHKLFPAWIFLARLRGIKPIVGIFRPRKSLEPLILGGAGSEIACSADLLTSMSKNQGFQPPITPSNPRSRASADGSRNVAHRLSHAPHFHRTARRDGPCLHHWSAEFIPPVPTGRFILLRPPIPLVASPHPMIHFIYGISLCGDFLPHDGIAMPRCRNRRLENPAQPLRPSRLAIQRHRPPRIRARSISLLQPGR